MEIDFKQHAQGDRVILEGGVYRVKLVKWEKVQAKTGAPQIRWFAEVDSGSNAGTSIVDHLQLLPQTAWKIVLFFQNALNLTAEQTASLGKLDTNSERFLRLLETCKGRRIYFTVIKDAYNGKISNKVEGFTPDDDQAPVDIDDIDDVPEFVKRK